MLRILRNTKHILRIMKKSFVRFYQCSWTTRSSYVTTESWSRFKFAMHIIWVTIFSSSSFDDTVVKKTNNNGIVVEMTTKIVTVKRTGGVTRYICLWLYRSTTATNYLVLHLNESQVRLTKCTRVSGESNLSRRSQSDLGFFYFLFEGVARSRAPRA